jgi:NAD kinase
MRLKYIENNDPRIDHFNKFIRDNYPQLLSETDPDLILVAGGDGAMLRAIQTRQQSSAPFLGKGLGTLNFLMNEFDDDERVIQSLIDDELELDIISTSSLKVCIKQNEETVCISEAVNDVVIGNHLMGYHEFVIDAEDGSFQDFQIHGTGICVSTPLGSTAYNFNNNGKILPLDSKLWSMTGVVCNRYLNDVMVEQQMNIGLNATKGQVSIFIDGIPYRQRFDKGVDIILEPGEEYKLAFLQKKNFVRRRIEVAHRFRKQG